MSQLWPTLIKRTHLIEAGECLFDWYVIVLGVQIEDVHIPDEFLAVTALFNNLFLGCIALPAETTCGKWVYVRACYTM